MCACSHVCLPAYVGSCTCTCFCVHVEVRGQSQMSFLGSCQHCVLGKGLSLTWSRTGFLAGKCRGFTCACLSSVVIIRVYHCMWVLCKDLRSSCLCPKTFMDWFLPPSSFSVTFECKISLQLIYLFAIWDLDFFYFTVKRIVLFWYNNSSNNNKHLLAINVHIEHIISCIFSCSLYDMCYCNTFTEMVSEYSQSVQGLWAVYQPLWREYWI